MEISFVKLCGVDIALHNDKIGIRASQGQLLFRIKGIHRADGP
jgi:hypothetical protein